MENKVYILGGAQSDFERNWNREGKGIVALLKENIQSALMDVSLTWNDVKKLNDENKIACCVGNFIAEKYVQQGHLGTFLTEVHEAFYGVPCARYEAACASSSAALDAAISKLKAKDYEVVIVVGWELMKTVDAKTGGDYLGYASYYEKEAKGVDYPFAKLFGDLAKDYVEKYNLNSTRYYRALSEIALKNYNNAKGNNNAQTRKWFIDSVKANDRGSTYNPWVGETLAITDCSQITDGAVTVVLTNNSKYNKKESELPIVKGTGHRNAPLQYKNKIIESKDSEYILPWTRRAVLDAYGKAGLSMENIDVFETHDCFTSSEYAAISAFGITKPGEEYIAIEKGWVYREGKHPINPSGGLIGVGHPVGASGCRMFLDLYKQITGTAGNYQVQNVKNGAMLNMGGSATTNFVFILGRDNE